MDLHDFDDVAQNYDLYVSALAGDEQSLIDFHLQLAESYGHQGILDIACGTGITLLPLLKHGYSVTGIDISAAMLAVLQKKLAQLPSHSQQPARVLCASMTNFHLEESASLAIIPRSGFLHLLTVEEQEQAIRNIYQHLTPNGILCFNTFDPNYALIGAHLKGSETTFELRTEYINSRGFKERLWNAQQYDPLQQVIEAQWVFEELNEKGEVIERRERPLRMRWSFESEIRHLLRLCGFYVLHTYSSYKKDPRVYGGWIIWIAEKV